MIYIQNVSQQTDLQEGAYYNYIREFQRVLHEIGWFSIVGRDGLL